MIATSGALTACECTVRVSMQPPAATQHSRARRELDGISSRQLPAMR